ncbi:MAG: hypothetical protein MZW92_81970 [Comamonadaceae bacterium]|nr:hypothetical protein [Comamonadaceae bacterium]
MWWLAHGEHARCRRAADWLSPREQALLGTLRFTKRRIEFLTRRWTAKRALATVLERDGAPGALAAIELGNHPGGAPYVEVDGRRASIEVSLSDRAGWAVCLVGTPSVGTGTDRHRPGDRRAAQRRASSTTSSPPPSATTCAAGRKATRATKRRT